MTSNGNGKRRYRCQQCGEDKFVEGRDSDLDREIRTVCPSSGNFRTFRKVGIPPDDLPPVLGHCLADPEDVHPNDDNQGTVGDGSTNEDEAEGESEGTSEDTPSEHSGWAVDLSSVERGRR